MKHFQATSKKYPVLADCQSCIASKQNYGKAEDAAVQACVDKGQCSY